MKRTKGTIERFSPEWIQSIPRSLARGIWDAIEGALEGEDHAGTRERDRRLHNIDRGKLKLTSCGVVTPADNAVDEYDQRCADRAEQTRELQRARAERISERSADNDLDAGHGESECEAECAGEGEPGATADNVHDDTGRSTLRVEGDGRGTMGLDVGDGDSVPGEDTEAAAP